MKRLLALLVLSAFSAHSQVYTSGNWRFYVSNGEAIITRYLGPGGAITLPQEIEGFPVRAIEPSHEVADYEDYGPDERVNLIGNLCTYSTWFTNINITSVYIPEGITRIGDWAFCGPGFGGLLNISMPTTLASIGKSVFMGCGVLNNVTLPNSLVSLGGNAFNGCSNLTSIIIPAGITHIPTGTFNWCTSLQEVIFLGNAPSTEYEAFEATPATILVTLGSQDWDSEFLFKPVVMSGAFWLTKNVNPLRGAITVSPQSQSYSWYADGAEVSLQALALPGYVFTAWSGSTNSTENPLLLTIHENITVSANFGPDSNDADGDGLSNYQEVVVFKTNPNLAETNSPVAGLYLASQYQSNWASGRLAGRNEIASSPNEYGLYTTNQIHNLGLGGIMLNRNTNNQLVLNYQILQSPDLQNWSPYQQNELVISNAPTNKMFLRVQAVGQ